VRGLRAIARCIQMLTNEADELERQIADLVTRAEPQLMALPGIGPISAAQILISWSRPGRLRSEAAFANVAGGAPIPASSGLTNRHRLNRGGDRQLNRALHTIVLTRSRTDPDTAPTSYGGLSGGLRAVARRISEGKTPET
jgi:transposase